MLLHVIASGSKANCYVMETENEALILECGVPFANIMKTLQYHNKAKGILLTHEHGDHAKYAKDFANHSILHGTSETLEVLGIKHGIAVEYGKTYGIGSFRVMPFKTKHDAVKPCGYLINHKECGNVLFATDTYYIPVSVENINTMIIECNYIDNVLQDNYDNGIVDKTRYERVMLSHMGLGTVVKYINGYKPEQLCKCKVVLIHTSRQNGNKQTMIDTIKEQCGLMANVFAPDNGDKIAIDKLPF